MPTDVMRKHLETELLRYAVQRQLLCGCGAILDVRRAVLLDGSEAGRPTAVACGACFDKAVRKGLKLDGLDITDGRPREKQGWRNVYTPPVTQAELEAAGQQRLL